jgi:alpha-mannosidase
MMNDKSLQDCTVHMIANAHIDPAWLWDWREGREEVFATCRSALDLMKECPELTFSRGSAATYEWIEQADSAMFDEIRTRVAEGRWEIVNGWWVQPDCNIPCGESFVRHSLYAKNYFREKFGVDVKVGYNVDSFGHCSVLPQVLKQAGFDYYVFFRPDPKEKELPSRLFWWQYADGSRVSALRAPHHYCSAAGEDMIKRIRETCAMADPESTEVACFYGIGNHGGGPTREHIRQIKLAQKMNDMPAVRFSTLGAFFEAALAGKQDLHIVNEDLQHHAVGCYTALSEVKRKNRESESLLLATERFATAATAFCGARNRQEVFAPAWKKVLFNQFHDILAGTSILPVYDDADEDYATVRRDASQALDAAFEQIGRNMQTQGPGGPILLFNSLAWDRKDVVVTDFLLPDFAAPFQLLNADGNPIPVQIIEQVDQAGRCRTRVCFVAEMPAMGCTVLHLVQGKAAKLPGILRAYDATIESERCKLSVDPRTGHMVSLRYKAAGSFEGNGAECLGGPGCVPVVLSDNTDTWSHGVVAFRHEIGRFTGPAKVVECGPVRAVIRTHQTYADSTIEQDFIIYSDLDRIDCEMRIDWHEKHKMLKLSLPVNVADPKATFEVPMGTMNRRSSGDEEPGQRWVDVAGLGPGGKPLGVALMNDSKYGYDVKDNEIRLSVLRSPIYAFHDPRVVEPFKRYIYTDQGRQTVRYSLLPHPESWRSAGVMREGYTLNNRAFAREINTQNGPAQPRFGKSVSFVKSSPDNVLAEVFKQAENGNGVIVRVYEAFGRDTDALLEMPLLNITHRFSIGHNQIKTFRIVHSTVTETNLLEE